MLAEQRPGSARLADGSGVAYALRHAGHSGRRWAPAGGGDPTGQVTNLDANGDGKGHGGPAPKAPEHRGGRE